MKPFPPLHLVRAPDEPGRNVPCPCGSGKRYKLCHGKPGNRPLSAAQRFHSTSHELHQRILQRADEVLGGGWGNPLLGRAPDDPALPFDVTVTLFVGELDDRSIAEWAFGDEEFEQSAVESEVLLADLSAWFSIWEVTAVTPGEGMTLVDQLTGVEREVEERIASRLLRCRDGVLARVAEYRGSHLVAGIHPMALPPIATSVVVDQMRKRLRRKSAIPVERLRECKQANYLVSLWDEATEDYLDIISHPPELVNTDGDAMLLTEDHFAVKPKELAGVLDALAKLPDVDVSEAGGAVREVVFLAGDRTATRATVHGVLRPTRSGLVLETNSLARADRLRRVLEEVVGPLLRHTLRVHPSHEWEGDHGPTGGARPQQPDLPPEILRELIDQYYRDWLDQPVPMLDDRTPREAATTKAGRVQLEILLKTLEHRDGGMMPVGQGPDVAVLRRELGMGL